MWVAIDHLLGHRFNHVREGEQGGFLRQAGVVDDLEKEIAKFLAKIVGMVAGDRVGDFVGLLDGVGRDGREGLLDVPGTAGFRMAESRHNADQAFNVAAGFHGGIHVVVA